MEHKYSDLFQQKSIFINSITEKKSFIAAYTTSNGIFTQHLFNISFKDSIFGKE